MIFLMAMNSCKYGSRKTGELIERDTVSKYENGKAKNIWLFPKANDPSVHWLLQYYENGSLISKGLVKNGKWEGHRQWWYEDGKKMDSAYFVDGKYSDIRKHWYPSGNVRLVEYLDSISDCDSCCLGAFIHFDSLGKISGEHVNHKRNDGTTFGYDILYLNPANNNGIIKTRTEYINGIKNGNYTEWHTNNEKIDGQYVNWNEEGIWHLYKNNKLFRIDNYKNGKRISKKNIDTLAIGSLHQ